MLKVPLGSTLRVTGICIIADTRAFNVETPFNILLRSFDDITVVASPSLLSIRNLILVVALLLAVVFVVVARGWVLERKMRRQAAAMSIRTEVEAVLERQRSRILEDINGSRPLAEILEEIAELVSFRLDGASCWCETIDGELHGNCPSNALDWRVARKEIAAHAGPKLGTIFAALDPLTAPAAIEREALSGGARLAALAIETRRLYIDLCRRSEFDQLTEVHNRFSLEKCLDARIAEAGKTASIFGLIYIDLDKFKQVNDCYGHHVGDLYLQEAARRMKHQLRDVDVMARLGGDEFAALVSVALNRNEIEEVAIRLERCLDEPFSIEGNLLRCSASVGIALYPDDGVTGDRLLNAADAAMYVIKNAKLD
jgi:diguanylate cyclase (GGDEF)-like protein